MIRIVTDLHKNRSTGRNTKDADLLLIRGGLRRHMGGGGGIRRRGEGLRGGGRILWGSTADAVISCPSIWPVNQMIPQNRVTNILRRWGPTWTRSPTSVHVLEGLLSLVRCFKLHVSVALRQVWVQTLRWHLNCFDFPISGKDLLYVVLCRKTKPCDGGNSGRSSRRYSLSWPLWRSWSVALNELL